MLQRNSMPQPIAIAAPIKVLMKLTTSFVIHSRFFFPCRVAPRTLSIFVATNAANIEIGTALGVRKPTDKPKREIKAPPTIDAAVPSALIAPSVPGETRCNVVIKNVVFP